MEDKVGVKNKHGWTVFASSCLVGREWVILKRLRKKDALAIRKILRSYKGSSCSYEVRPTVIKDDGTPT